MVLPINQVQHQLFEFFMGAGVLLLSSPAPEKFQLAHPNEGRGDTCGDGNRLRNELVGIQGMGARRVPGAPYSLCFRNIEAQRPGGRHTQCVHVLLGQEFTNAGTQDRTAITTTAIRRLSATLELHFPALTVQNSFQNRNGATVAIAVAGLERALLGVFGAVDGKCIATGPADFAHGRRHL